MAIEANMKLFTTTDVAAETGLKPDTIRKFVQRGVIRPQDSMIGNAYIFSESELKRFKRSRRRRGNPTFSRSK